MAGFIDTLKELLSGKSSDNTVIGLSQLKGKKFIEPEPDRTVKKTGEVKLSDLIRGESY